MATEAVNDRPPLTALDFVRMYLWQTEHHPQQGHYVNAFACRIRWDNKDDPHSRCTRCDGEALLKEAGVSLA